MLLISGFPAGTVSGAPKIRAMEIIAEIEKDKRSFTLVALAILLPMAIWKLVLLCARL